MGIFLATATGSIMINNALDVPIDLYAEKQADKIDKFLSEQITDSDKQKKIIAQKERLKKIRTILDTKGDKKEIFRKAKKFAKNTN